MLHPYERHLTLSYLSHMLERLGHSRRESAAMTEWLEENASLLTTDTIDEEDLKHTATTARESAEDWQYLCEIVEEASVDTATALPDQMGRRLKRLGESVGLSSLDVALLEVLIRYRMQPVIETLIDAPYGVFRSAFSSPLNIRNGMLPFVLGKSSRAICSRFAHDAPLVSTGLVAIETSEDVDAISRLDRLSLPAPEESDVRSLLLGKRRESELHWSDFDHLGQNRDDVAQLLSGAVAHGAKGVNILVYGSPGTGKTEFCRVLAKQLNLSLFGIGEVDDRGGEPSRSERLAELRLAQSLVGQNADGLLLFDEMEDLLVNTSMLWPPFGRVRSRAKQGSSSKVFMNRMLEETPTPILWTTNHGQSIEPHILRRMKFALEMRLPPARIRARIWTRQLSSHGIEASSEQALSLANEFPASPGVAAGATTAASIAGGDFNLVRRGVRNLSKVLGCERAKRPVPRRFDPELLESDMDLGSLADRLVNQGKRHFSMCIQGPPGTGKSAYAAYLAERLGLEFRQVRASDLIDKYVGESEKNIAREFANAREDEAFLVFDEADSLLADRRGAWRSWEISQVNEMLTWMESHPMPFVCTTNYGEKLDEAALRRFTFKTKMGFLKRRSARAAFQRYFGFEAPSELDDLSCLTPGDFEVVRRKADVLGELSDRDALVEMLRAECAVKPQSTPTIGF